MAVKRGPCSFGACQQDRLEDQCPRDSIGPDAALGNVSCKECCYSDSDGVTGERDQRMKHSAVRLKDCQTDQDGIPGHICDECMAQAEKAPTIGGACGRGEKHEQYIALGRAYPGSVHGG